MTTAQQKKEPLLHTTIPEEVRKHYMDSLEPNVETRFDLDETVFRRIFAEVAHTHGIYFHRGKQLFQMSAEEREERQWYNNYYTVALHRLRAWLKQEKNRSADEKVRLPMRSVRCEVPHCLCEPAQQDLFNTRLPHHSVRTATVTKRSPQEAILIHSGPQLDLFERHPPVSGRPLGKRADTRHL